ncbi:hypothetical protein ACWEJ6_02935 [Nonomuraea sp. NPDC004702]
MAELADDASFLSHIADALRQAEIEPSKEGEEAQSVSDGSDRLADALAAITRLKPTRHRGEMDKSREASLEIVESTVGDIIDYSRDIQQISVLISQATAFQNTVEEAFNAVSTSAQRWATLVPSVLDRAYLIDQSRIISAALLDHYRRAAEAKVELAEIADIDVDGSSLDHEARQSGSRVRVPRLHYRRAEETLFADLDGPELERARSLYREFRRNLAAAEHNFKLARDIAEALAWVHRLVGRNEIFSWLGEPAACIADLANIRGDVTHREGDSDLSGHFLVPSSSEARLSTLWSRLSLIADRVNRLAHLVELDRPEHPEPVILAASLLESLLQASMALEIVDPDELERLIVEASNKQDAYIRLRSQAGNDASRISGLGQLQLQISSDAAKNSLKEIRNKLDIALTVRVAMLGALLEQARSLVSATQDIERDLLLVEKWDRQNKAAAGAFAEQLATVVLAEAESSPDAIVVIYVSDHRDANKIEESVERVVDAFGRRITQRGVPLLGSWLRILKAKAKEAANTEAGQDVALKLQRAIELKSLHETQARVDDVQAGAAAKLIESVEGTPRAFIQIGSIVLIKDDGVLAVITLSQRQLVFLERNPHLIRDPLELLAALRACDSDPSLQLVKGDGVAGER